MRGLVFLLTCLISGQTLAIVNIENLRMDESKIGFSTSATVSANGKRGNTEEDKYALNGGIQWINQDQQRRDLLLFSAKQDQSNGDTYSESYFLHLRHTEQLTDNWAWETYVQHQSEPLNQQALRQLVGMNARVRLQSFPFNGFGGLGLMYEKRSIEPIGAAIIERDATRLNFYLNSKYALTENTQWAISLYAQPNIEEIDDVRSIASSGITTHINSLFAFTFDMSYSHDSRPLLGQKQTDWTYSTGINLRF